MNLAQQLKEYILAAFSGIWIQTFEPDEAQREIARLCTGENWNCEVWDCAHGNHRTGTAKSDPIAPLDTHTPVVNDKDPITSVLILHNYHRFLTNPMVVQALANKIMEGKADRLFVVVLSPVVQIPIELEKLFVVIEHDLPDRSTLNTIASEICGHGDKLDDNGDKLGRVLDAANGLTRYEAEGAFALSLVRHDHFDANTISELKASILKKTGLLEMYRGTETFASIGGLEALKGFTSKALAPNRPVLGRGVLLLGVPGTGKSAFARALGNQVCRPLLSLDIGHLMGSLVGQTEANIRSALRIADAMQPCVLFIDEIEKALAGHGSNGDSGVATRLFGTLLTWLNDHTSDVFVVATSNDVSKLPPEFSRAERWDGIFFLDLPTQQERRAIWQLYLDRYPCSSINVPTASDDNWTGAEIKACCRLAALLDVPLLEAAQHVVPVAATAPEKVAALREWASGRCLDASKPGLFQSKPQNLNGRTRRRTISDN